MFEKSLMSLAQVAKSLIRPLNLTLDRASVQLLAKPSEIDFGWLRKKSNLTSVTAKEDKQYAKPW